MSGLFGSLSIGIKTLSNMQAAIAVVNDNIANVNTEGYSRKRVIFASSKPEYYTFGSIGTGAHVSRVESIRNGFLDARILGELQLRGSLAGQKFALEQVEAILYNEGRPGISDQISRFFNSFSELASNPASLASRQVVLGEGAKLATSIASAYQSLSSLRQDNRVEARNAAEQVNLILEQIARLNLELSPLISQGQDGGSLADQRQVLMNRLAEQMDFVSYRTESGSMTITTSGGVPLVIGAEFSQLRVDESNSGFKIEVQGTDITSQLTGGKLAAYVELDNKTLPGYLAALDSLAQSIADQVNTVHRQGVALDGQTTDQDFFTYDPLNAAQTLMVALTGAELVAAGSAGSGPADGTFAQRIADLRDLPVAALGNNTFSSYYSELIFQIGLDSRYVNDSLATQDKIILQLQNQRDSVSGVSLDEEAISLIEYQRAYQASSRFIMVVNQLLDETMNLIR
jgi:flagellar hook-associated protein 1